MDIAFVVRRFGRQGGVSRYTMELATRFAPNHQVSIYTAEVEPGASTGLRLIRIPFITSEYLNRRREHAANTLLEAGSFMLSAPKLLDRGRHDIVHSQGDIACGTDVVTAHSCHKAWVAQERREAQGPAARLRKSAANPLHALILRLEKASVTRSSRVIAISERVKEQLLEQYRLPLERIAVIPNGVDTERFHPSNRARDREEVRAKLGLRTDDPLAIFPAHEFRRKGLPVLIEAMRRLDRSLHLLVVGRDDPAPFVSILERHRLERQVHFVGHAAEIERLYAAADMMLLPTRFEAFGLVITEAMSSGLPVIISGEAGAAELVVDGEEGLLLRDPNDVEEVAGAVRKLLDDAPMRDRLGTAARRKAELYSWEKVARRTFELYEAVAREKARA